jgi:hypothetical protein
MKIAAAHYFDRMKKANNRAPKLQMIYDKKAAFIIKEPLT